MKNLRLVAFVVFAVCAFSLPAQAQNKWTYKADNGLNEVVTIIITQRPNGYEVTGEIRGLAHLCDIRGQYFPASQRLRASCDDGYSTDVPIDGFKIQGRDALQITAPFGGGGQFRPFVVVAERVGAKPDVKASTNSSGSVTGCGLGRVWDDVESGHNQTWTRQGDSNVFKAAGIVNGEKFTATQSITITGNRVSINRYEASDGNTCTFDGTIEGGTASGTYHCSKYAPSSGWRATIHCN